MFGEIDAFHLRYLLIAHWCNQLCCGAPTS